MIQRLVRYFIDALIIMCGCLVVVSLVVFLYIYQYEGRIFPNVSVDGYAVGGLSSETAERLLTEKTEEALAKGFTYLIDGHSPINIPSRILTDDPALAQEIVDVDIQKTVLLAYETGRTGTMWERLNHMIFPIKTNFIYSINDSLWRMTMEESLETLVQKGTEPELLWHEDGSYEITRAQKGIEFDLDAALIDTRSMVSSFSITPINLIKKNTDPRFSESDASPLLTVFDELKSVLPAISLIYEKQKWKFFYKEYIKWIVLSFNEETKKPALNISKEKLYESIKEMRSVIERAPQDAKLEIKDNKVKEFIPSRNGREIDMDNLVESITESLFNTRTNSVSLIVKEALPKIHTKDVNTLGITEVVGTGESNFAGSPANRIHNIKIGVHTVDGTLLAPNEEFSLIALLGSTTAEQGYLPELVIKGNKTQKEYGGGLCQIGTTVFRAALSSGLKILERRNHSYNVTYYLEDGLPGVDATIYYPKPDLRFLNDTGNYILISGRVEGTNVFFDFWGTKDGRTAYRTTPSVWGWTDPGPVQYVETDELKFGEEKCTERAHKGVKASFDYVVKYSDGHEEKETFFSNYKAWPAICMRGKDPNAPTVSTDVISVDENGENNNPGLSNTNDSSGALSQ